VNCDEEKMKPICAQEKVKGFPTLKIYKADKISGGRKSEGNVTKKYAMNGERRLSDEE